MKRTELLNAFLKLMYEDNGNSWYCLYTFANQNGIEDDSLIVSVGKELECNGWVEERRLVSSSLSYMLTYEGKKMMRQYGSYTNYQNHLTTFRKKDEEEKTKKEAKVERNQRLERRNMRWAIAASIATILLFILTIFQFFNGLEKDKEIEGLKKQLQELEVVSSH